MTAFHMMVYHDLLERQSKPGELTPAELRRLNELHAQAEQEYENEPPHFMYGGDYPDVF